MTPLWQSFCYSVSSSSGTRALGLGIDANDEGVPGDRVRVRRGQARQGQGFLEPALSRCSGNDRAPRRSAQRGGLSGPIDARREPREMAPGSYVLVLRNLSPDALPAGIRGLSSL